MRQLLLRKGAIEKYMYLEVNRVNKDWYNLWLMMCDYDQARYKILKGTDCFEFWFLFDAWKEKIAKQNASFKKTKNR